MGPLTSLGGDYAWHRSQAKGARAHPLQRHTVQRLSVAVSLFGALFLVLGARLAFLALFVSPAETGLAARSLATPMRAEILDRNGAVLATQIRSTILGAHPRAIMRPAKTAAGLKQIFPELDESRLLDDFLLPRNPYFVIRRDVTPAEHKQVLQLGEPGLKMETVPKRVYPHGALTGHVVGFVNQDLVGLAGLEYVLDRSAEPHKGLLVSSLDVRVQHIVRETLAAGMRLYRAQAAAGLVMDARSGEMLAMVSLPDFDPHRPQTASPAQRFNRTSLGVYELGSVFKLYTAAMALETNRVTDGQQFDVRVPLRVGRHLIADAHGEERVLSLDEVIAYSSNVGAVQLALLVPARAHWAFLERLGLMRRPQLDLPELAHPILPPQWGDVTRATVAFGHGIAVSPLQAIAAGAALVNGGLYYEPHVQLGARRAPVRVLSEATSARMRQMMRTAVTLGTGRQANLNAWQVLGKTGTAEKPGLGGYDEDRLVVSFLSAFPGHAPRYVLFVMLDEPQGIDATFGFAEAGWNVVPLSREIIGRAAPLLGLTPTPPKEDGDATGRVAG